MLIEPGALFGTDDCRLSAVMGSSPWHQKAPHRSNVLLGPPSAAPHKEKGEDAQFVSSWRKALGAEQGLAAWAVTLGRRGLHRGEVGTGGD